MKKNEDELVERENVTVNKLFEENSKGGHNAKINLQILKSSIFVITGFFWQILSLWWLTEFEKNYKQNFPNVISTTIVVEKHIMELLFQSRRHKLLKNNSPLSQLLSIVMYDGQRERARGRGNKRKKKWIHIPQNWFPVK